MKNYIKFIFGATVILFSISLTGCVGGASELEQDFIETESIHLTVKGKEIMRYDPLNCQCAFSPSSAEFKVCEDNMRDYYILRCDRVPDKVGDKVECDVEWTTHSDIRERKNLDFILVKADSETGVMWLWCQSARIGAAVRAF